jgi:hypothetical protein
MSENEGFICSSCGQRNNHLPFDYGSDFPDIVFELPESERKARVISDSDFCVVDNRYYFVRGIIQLHVVDYVQDFAWGVWVSLSEQNFGRMVKLLNDPTREKEPVYFGWLSTELPYPQSTINLKTMVHTQRVGLRPMIELEPTSHPLAIEQKEGITFSRVQQIAEKLLHGS